MLAFSCLILVLGACGPQVAREGLEVVRTFPHDPAAYTQGLVFHEGLLYESTGRYGESDLREIDAATGEVLRLAELPEEYFAEGLALVGDRLIQLTWMEGTAFVYDRETFERIETLEYEGDGWGLCHDGESLFMTTGGSILYRRDPRTFEVLESRPITIDGRSLRQVNELVCVGNYIYANVFMTDRIVRIDKRTASVVSEIDASGLVPEGGRPSPSDAVLNGIAYDPAAGTFYLTGKLWPSMFEVRFIPQ